MDNQHWWQDQTAGRSCTQAGDACDHDDDEEEDMFGYDDDDVDWVGDIWIADNWGPNEHLRNGTPATASASTVHWVWCAGSHLPIKMRNVINLIIVVIITSITIVTNLLSAELSESDIVDSCIGLNILHLFVSNYINIYLWARKRIGTYPHKSRTCDHKQSNSNSQRQTIKRQYMVESRR